MNKELEAYEVSRICQGHTAKCGSNMSLSTSTPQLSITILYTSYSKQSTSLTVTFLNTFRLELVVSFIVFFFSFFFNSLFVFFLIFQRQLFSYYHTLHCIIRIKCVSVSTMSAWTIPNPTSRPSLTTSSIPRCT